MFESLVIELRNPVGFDYIIVDVVVAVACACEMRRSVARGAAFSFPVGRTPATADIAQHGLRRRVDISAYAAPIPRLAASELCGRQGAQPSKAVVYIDQSPLAELD